MNRPLWGHSRLHTVHGLLPLVLGCLIYVTLKPASRLWDWASEAGPETGLAVVRTGLSALHLPVWIPGSLADGLWAYAWSAAAMLIWHDGTKRRLVFCASSGFAASAAVEALQRAQAIGGTFDWWDIGLAAAGSAAAVAFVRPGRPNQSVRLSGAGVSSL